VQAYVAEFGFTETEIAEAEGQMIEVGVELGQEPGGVAVGSEELYDGFEIEAPVLAVDCGELARPSSRSFWCWAGVMSCMCSSPV
jgi:hypothetical protein